MPSGNNAGEYEKIGFRVVIELVPGPFWGFDDRPARGFISIELICKGGQVGHADLIILGFWLVRARGCEYSSSWKHNT